MEEQIGEGEGNGGYGREYKKRHEINGHLRVLWKPNAV